MPMAAPTLQEAERIWLQVNSVRKISDRIIGLGPFGIGLDGIIAMLNNPLSGPLAPLGIAADQLYTWIAGLYLLSLGMKVQASGATLFRMIAYLVIDSLVGLIPWLGGPIDLIFQGHQYAARALQKDIERRYPWPPKP
jgi:hypothetical protein